MVRKIADVLKADGHLEAMRTLASQLAQQLDECADPDLRLSISRAFINVSRAITTAERAELARKAALEREAATHGVDSVENFLAQVNRG